MVLHLLASAAPRRSDAERTRGGPATRSTGGFGLAFLEEVEGPVRGGLPRGDLDPTTSAAPSPSSARSQRASDRPQPNPKAGPSIHGRAGLTVDQEAPAQRAGSKERRRAASKRSLRKPRRSAPPVGLLARRTARAGEKHGRTLANVRRWKTSDALAWTGPLP